MEFVVLTFPKLASNPVPWRAHDCHCLWGVVSRAWWVWSSVCPGSWDARELTATCNSLLRRRWATPSSVLSLSLLESTGRDRQSSKSGGVPVGELATVYPHLCLLPPYFSGGVQGAHWLPAPAGGPAEPRAPHPPAVAGTAQHGEDWAGAWVPKAAGLRQLPSLEDR